MGTKATVMDAASVRHAYRRWAPVYDFTFGPTLHAGRIQAIQKMGIEPGDRSLEALEILVAVLLQRHLDDKGREARHPEAPARSEQRAQHPLRNPEQQQRGGDEHEREVLHHVRRERPVLGDVVDRPVGHRPQHRVDEDEDHAGGAEAEPDQRQRQQRDRRQRVEHRRQRLEEVGAGVQEVDPGEIEPKSRNLPPVVAVPDEPAIAGRTAWLLPRARAF